MTVAKLKRSEYLHGKILWPKSSEKFIRKNFETMSNRELADHFGMHIQTMRTKLYEMGLYRMRLQYWTEEQIRYLKKNYKKIGDKELSEIFTDKWPKEKGWTLKHIEKKRKYLNLKRSKIELKAIHQRNVDQGRFLLCPVKRWLVTGVAQEGEIRMWRENSGRLVPRIKINGKFIHWARWAYINAFGEVPPKMNVVFADGNPENQTIENLELIADGELSRRNSMKSSQGLSDNYIAGVLTHGNPEARKELKKYPEILELKRQQLKLNRLITNEN